MSEQRGLAHEDANPTPLLTAKCQERLQHALCRVLKENKFKSFTGANANLAALAGENALTLT